MKHRATRTFKTAGAMADFAAELFRKAVLGKAGRFTAALSGGSTPERLFKKLSALRLPWDRVVFFMADERLVPLSSGESNFAAARAQLFSRIGIPRRNLRPVSPGIGAAAAYARALLKETGGSGRLDFIFLGLGEDGHTASLFAGSPALKEKKRAVCSALAPDGAKIRRRITLALKTINSASSVVLMAAGPSKKAIFGRALRRDKKIPAGLLNPRGEMYLLYSSGK